jgi:UDP-N-acetylglucosamine acyltransferase
LGIGHRVIHSTAIIDAKAEVPESVSVGPHSVIDAGVALGQGCVIGPYVHLTGQTTIGKNNTFHTGAVMGDAPQDLKYDGAPTRLRIGDENIFREHVTLNRSNSLEEDTVIGSHNFFMAHSHVGHNTVVGDHNIFANAALLGGHVVVGDHVFISAYCGVHQFVRVGSLSMMQGHSGASKDVPPFTMVSAGLNKLCGLNSVGLRRAEISPEDRSELKRCYQRIFMGDENIGQAVEKALEESPGKRARELLEFIAASKRGVCVHGSRKD